MKIEWLLITFSLMVLSCSSTEVGEGGNVRIAIDSYSSAEGNDTNAFDFNVRLSETTASSVSVEYNLEEITATKGEDFEDNSGVLSFGSSETSKTISVNVLGDDEIESDEQFRVVLSNPSGATISNGTAIGTIINDDITQDTTDGYVTPLSYEGYDLVWNDEFNGSQIDLSCWTFEFGATGWGNNELQNYTDNNAFIEDGSLVIEAREENGGYTSTRMITGEKKEFVFGRIDIRAKLPQGQGVWPALWMLGANWYEQGWPYCGEIDIMELVGHEPSKVHGTAHWGEQGWSGSIFKGGSYTLKGGERFSEKYHVFSIIWELDNISWYVDDELYHTLNIADLGTQEYPFNKEFFFLFNIAVGGNWPGNPDETTVFPQRMYVDYIRVFQ